VILLIHLLYIVTMTIQELYGALQHVKFDLSSEKSLQLQIAKRLDEKGISYKKEFIFDKTSTIDFLIDDIGVEIKIKGAKKDIYKQCLRYSTYEQVKQILLVTNVAQGMPKTLNEKPVYILNLANAWL